VISIQLIQMLVQNVEHVLMHVRQKLSAWAKIQSEKEELLTAILNRRVAVFGQ